MRNPVASRPVRAELLHLADSDPTRWGLVCLQIARFERWEVYPDVRECRRMVRRRLNARRRGNAPRNFDGDWLLIVLDHFPESSLAALFQRQAARAEARRELGREVA
jgi:hypothetical protein